MKTTASALRWDVFVTPSIPIQGCQRSGARHRQARVVANLFDPDLWRARCRDCRPSADDQRSSDARRLDRCKRQELDDDLRHARPRRSLFRRGRKILEHFSGAHFVG